MTTRRAVPTVSVIIPVYNAEAFLAEAIESVLGQSALPQQVIVVDDGSTDQSVQIAQRYQKDILFAQQAHGGSARARNHGVTLAQGEFLAFLDHDDYWVPEKLARQLDAFHADPQLEAVYGQTRQTQSSTTVTAQQRHFGFNAKNGCHIDTLLIRQAAFWRVGPFDPAWLSDTVEWMWRARRMGISTRILPDILAWRRIHDANQSIRGRSQAHAEYLRLIRLVLHQRRQSMGKPHESMAAGQGHDLPLAEGT